MAALLPSWELSTVVTLNNHHHHFIKLLFACHHTLLLSGMATMLHTTMRSPVNVRQTYNAFFLPPFFCESPGVIRRLTRSRLFSYRYTATPLHYDKTSLVMQSTQCKLVWHFLLSHMTQTKKKPANFADLKNGGMND